MKKRFTDEQVIRILREAESRDELVKDLCKRHNISEQTFYRWRAESGISHARSPAAIRWDAVRAARAGASSTRRKRQFIASWITRLT